MGKKLFKVDVVVPVNSRGERFPLDWKTYNPALHEYNYRKKATKGEFGYTTKGIIVPAINPKEAEELLRQRITEAYGELPESFGYGGYGDNFKKVDWDGSKRKKDHKLGLVRDITGYEEYSPQKLSDEYIDIEGCEELLYASAKRDLFSTEGTESLLGIVLSFKEVERLIKDQKLPEIFLKNPHLIPKVVYQGIDVWRSDFYTERKKKNRESLERVEHHEEELTLAKQREIARGLLHHDEDPDVARGFTLHSNLTDKIRAYELFPDEMFFWTYNPLGKDIFSYHERFHKICYFWNGNQGFIHARGIVIRTKRELEDYVRQEAQSRIRECSSKITKLTNSCEEEISRIMNLPKFSGK